MIWRTLILLICLFVSLNATLAEKVSAEEALFIPESNDGLEQNMTQADLQFALMEFADRFASQTLWAATELENRLGTPAARLQAQKTKFYSIASAFNIAAGPSPEAGLLDIIVLTTLNRIVWDEYWRPEVFGEAAIPLVTSYRDLEEEIWAIATTLTTTDQQQVIKSMIQVWRKNNLDVRDVDFVRFSDFKPLRRRATALERQEDGGILAGIENATRAVKRTELLGERVTFLLGRMQILLSLQAVLVSREISQEPDILEIKMGVTQLSKDVSWLQQYLDQLPEEITTGSEVITGNIFTSLTKERTDAIDQLMRQLHSERIGAVEQVEESIDRFNSEFQVNMQKAEERLFWDAVLLIIIFLTGTVLALFIYRYLVFRFLTER